MKVSTSIICIFAAFSISCLSVCYGTEPMITIQYPATFVDYYNFVSKLPEKSEGSKTEKITLEELCIASAESSFFVFIDDNTSVSVPKVGGRGYIVGWIKDWQRDTREQFASEMNIDGAMSEVISVLKIEMPGLFPRLDVMPCFILENGAGWFIATLFNSDTYFSINKMSANDPYKVNGILESIPIIDEELSNDPVKLEETFQNAYNSDVTGRKTLTKLDPTLQLMRVCSAAYTAWTKKKEIKDKGFHLFRVSSGIPCVIEATIVLDHIVSAEEGSPAPTVKADLIACAVTAEWDKPQFYLAADPENVSGVYVAEKKIKNVFSLIMHVTDITALKQNL